MIVFTRWTFEMIFWSDRFWVRTYCVGCLFVKQKLTLLTVEFLNEVCPSNV